MSYSWLEIIAIIYVIEQIAKPGEEYSANLILKEKIVWKLKLKAQQLVLKSTA